jgi:hypothetical protein
VPTVQRACIRKTRAKKGLDANHTKKGLAARPLHGRYAGCKKKKKQGKNRLWHRGIGRAQGP